MRPSFAIGVVLCSSTVVLAGMLAGAGCTVLTNDGLPDDAGKFDGSGDATSPVCASCLANECTGPFAACLTDPACDALAKRASSATCEASDAAVEDGGVDPGALYAAFTSCVAARSSAGAACATDCTGSPQPSPCATDGGASDSGASDATDASASDASDASDDAASADAGDADASGDAGTTAPVTASVDGCASCVSGTCGDAKKACAIGTECATYLECVYGAANAAASDECGKQHASGKTAAEELANCTRIGCSAACGF